MDFHHKSPSEGELGAESETVTLAPPPLAEEDISKLFPTWFIVILVPATNEPLNTPVPSSVLNTEPLIIPLPSVICYEPLITPPGNKVVIEPLKTLSVLSFDFIVVSIDAVNDSNAASLCLLEV